MDDTKVCRVCEEEKPEEEFYNVKANRDGLCGSCKACCIEWGKSHYLKNREKILSKLREKCKTDQHRRRVKSYAVQKNFGININDFDEMMKKQNGLCAICGMKEPILGRSLAIDHCHESGKVRGLLCSKCNRGLGLLQDSEYVLQNAISYLRGEIRGDSCEALAPWENPAT